MMIALLFALATSRIYHQETVDSIAKSRHTHVAVLGTVTFVKREADGDIHIRLSDAHGHFVVCEIVPYHPLPVPKVGQPISVRGIRRFDNETNHGWWELHPVEDWARAIP